MFNHWKDIDGLTYPSTPNIPMLTSHFIRILTNMGQLQVHVGITMAQASGYGGVSFIRDLYKVCSTTEKQLVAGLTYPATPAIPMLSSHSASSKF